MGTKDYFEALQWYRLFWKLSEIIWVDHYSSTVGDKAKLRERDVEGRGSGRILRRKIPGFTTTNDLIYQTFPVLLSGLDKPALAD